jgi:O-antigen/teichoic acid export membrane protein
MTLRFDPALRRLLRGSGLMLALNAGSALFSLIAAALAGRALGGARFGVFTFCMAWTAGLVTLCEAGLDGVIEREAAREPAHAPAVVKTGLAIKAAVALLACGAVALAAPRLAGADAVHALRLAALQAGGLALLGVFNAGFRGRGAFGLIVGAGLLSAAAQSLGTFAIVQAGGSETDLIGLATFVAWAQCLGVGAVWRARRGQPANARVPVARLISLALPFLAGVAVRVAQGRIAPLGLAYLSAPLEVGLFGAASRVADTARLPPNAVLQGAYSLFSGGGADRRKAFLAYAGAAGLLGSLGALAIGAAGPALTMAVFGPGFTAAGPAIVALGLAFLPSVIADAAITYLYAAGEAPAAVRLNGVATVVQLGAMILMAGMWGAVGAGLSITLARTVTCIPLAALAWQSARKRFWGGESAR